MLIHVDDLTEAVSAEATLQQSAALAQLGALSASVAHELRNPLAGMSAAIQVLIPSFAEQDRRRVILGKVHDQVRRLDGLVSELLNFAKPGHARMVEVPLAAVVDGVLDLVRAEAPNIEFARVGSGVASADANMVHQIVLNLVQNAVHQLPAGGKIRCNVSDHCIDVHDSGAGVPPDTRADIFKPFFTTHTRGTGLGLAICTRNARAMGGDLRLGVQSDLGGACFVLEFARQPT